MRTSVWAEVQEAVRGPHAIPRGESEQVFEICDWAGRLVQRITATGGCRLCGCPHDAHSKVLPFAPCLDCDCIGWTA